MEKKIKFFESSGEQNTDELIRLIKSRKEELGIKNIVVASVSGKTALKIADEIPDMNIVNVTHHAGFKEKGKMEIDSEKKKTLEKRGIHTYTSSHALSGVGRGISNKFGGVTPVEVMAETLRMISQGFKVCVEISIMAADGGFIPTEQEIIAVGGNARGADTAVILTPAHMNSIFDLRIHEIIAMPRP
ncbi:MAG: pyruvate kinase alpha/beta domain-containing protein [Methanobacteriaceae archaeon]|nr:pyruvate kinase alpha/beta domain-containing protein [Methanobacteriaceae archaeon]